MISNQKFKVLYLSTRTRELFPQSLVAVASVKGLDVTDPAAGSILHNVSSDWIIACSVPVEYRIALVLNILKAKGIPILGLGPTPSDLADLVMSKFTPIHSMRSACHLLIMLSQSKPQEVPVVDASGVHDFEKMVAILERAVNLRVPGSHERARRVAWLAYQVGSQLKLSSHELGDLVVAARLREIGKIGVPDEVLFTDLNTLAPERIRIYENYAALGAVILRTLPELELVSQYIGYQLENLDGSGPSGILAGQTPLGARILRVCGAYERIEATNGLENAAESLVQMWSAANVHYDPNVLAALDAVVSRREFQPNTESILIPVNDLKPGMMLGQSIYDNNGFRMLAYGAEITAGKINAIISHLKLSGQAEIAVISESLAKD